MDNRPVYRCHWRGQLTTDDMEMLRPLLAACEEKARAMIDAGELMTAALYHFGRQVFLYYEAIGEEWAPESFMDALSPVLAPWPQKEETRLWAQMYHIYWHDAPLSADDWRRVKAPERRRGRIAYLKHETMFQYVYHHFAIVEEGKLCGDRYQSIALHEDVLFSYFEEPRSHVNIVRDPSQESEAIQAWLDVNPEAHFIPLPGSEGANFLLLPEFFAIG